MIKKLFFISLTIFTLQWGLLATTQVQAQDISAQDQDQSSQTQDSSKWKTEDKLLYKFNYTDAEKAKNATKLSYVAGLPEGSWQSILTQVIKIILSVTGSLALLSFTVAGLLFLTAQGEEDKVSKAKKILLWSILALAIIAVSYAIVTGISQLNFFG